MSADGTSSTVGNLMSSEPILVWLDTPVSDVADLLDRSGISGVPVVDWGGYLVGVVSQTDLLRVRASDNLWADWSRLCARHIMSQPALTVTIDTPVEQAVHLMESHHVHRLVVVADDGESPIGILSATDLVRSMAVAWSKADLSGHPDRRTRGSHGLGHDRRAEGD